MTKAIALISGGLDSLLAARLIAGQGIDVIGVKFKIPFYVRRESNLNDFGFEVRKVDISGVALEMIKSPRYGFGSNMNPCIDCKILMLARAGELMREWGADFVITGEVLGQRPMSQHRNALEVIAAKSGLEGLVVRPLSGKILPATIPEERGWILRERLLDIAGRSRKRQMDLAAEFGIGKYAQPAGGCLLTDPEFSKRLKDLMSHDELNAENIELLKIGRHFRISPQAKLIVGRNESEDTELSGRAASEDYLFSPKTIAGPTSLARGRINDGLIKLCCGITAFYCDNKKEPVVELIYKLAGQNSEISAGTERLPQEEFMGLKI